MAKDKTENTEVNKPKVKLLGEDSNVFNSLGICTKALKRNNQADKARELTTKVFASSSYDEALIIMGEYCEIE